MIRPFGDGRDRYFTERLGMFIHWGLYAIPAWHEQILWRSDMKRRDYEQLVHRFNPERFDPDEWLVAAESAGISFVVITTKHHDGFCLWDTRLTEYSVMHTPYGRDILAELAEACERRGIALGFYYSCPDWHHPQYPNLGRHHEMFGPRPGDQPDLGAYWEFVRGQVRELCTNYGPLRDFFWDVNVAEHHDPSLNEMVRELQPGILINDRGASPGDYGTPERHVPEARSSTHRRRRCRRSAVRAGAIAPTRTTTATVTSSRASTACWRWAATTFSTSAPRRTAACRWRT